MPFDIFATHTMLAAIQQLTPATSFLRDRYFPTNDATDIFATEDVLVEYRSGDKKLAPFVSPRKGGVTILREGYRMDRYTPPYIAPKRPLTADDLKKKGFGEAFFSTLTPEERQGALMLKDHAEMDAMIARREEAMAAETLLTNGCIMKHIADDTGLVEEKVIQFYDGESNPAQYTPSVDWSDPTAPILADIFAVAELLKAEGCPATDLIVDAVAGRAVLSNEEVLKQLDNNNVHIGRIDPKQLPTGATYLASLNAMGHIVDVIMYSENYKDDDGVNKPYITAGKAILTAPACGRTLYGAVTQLEQADDKFHTYANKRVPKYYSDVKTNTRELTLTSCPLCIPNNKNAWITINAIND